MVRSEFHRSAGFSVIELMIVMAIIGIATAIAIPSYGRYQAKVRQSEAKMMLSDLFTNELNYSVEALTFTACLYEIGFAPVVSKMGYAVGFTADQATQTTCGPRGDASCSLYWVAGDGIGSGGFACSTAPAAGGRAAQTEVFIYDANFAYNPTLPIPGEAELPPGGVLNQTQFRAAAVGSIFSGSPRYDVWTIDQDKRLLNLTSGL